MYTLIRTLTISLVNAHNPSFFWGSIMNAIRNIVAAVLFALLGSVASAAEKDTEIICGDSFYVCLSGDDLKALSGKTLKYQHPRPAEFGIVTVTLHPGGKLDISHAKSSATGRWEIRDEKVEIDIPAWNDKPSWRFVRIGTHLFLNFNYAVNGSGLIPVAAK